ncbi:hypothetical protein LEP1GSC041_3684 [Leptospira noguchii str. 2006001870]|uniref:Uncharacterized protein n=1 Tax=Leptospira noguchii serovar Autumnalis str. ZUN142 TaxID=1085540 RepID=M6UDU1_9LEPT|nr:hypothetical protein LEP1GSC041_3684 [Leptospira noguchii str. 2006001870]EMO39259.1 hypothetical protein LEP1GSC186_0071 [Leptospira noguchii serovar Autumnalis str. ZUN142]
MTKRSFIETMGAFGGSIFSGYTTQDYLSDIRKVRLIQETKCKRKE